MEIKTFRDIRMNAVGLKRAFLCLFSCILAMAVYALGCHQAPLNIEGAWRAELQDTRRSEGRPGAVEFNMILMQEGDSIGGSFTMSLPDEVNLMGAITGEVSGNRVMLVATVVEPNYVNQTTFTARLKNGLLKGEYAGGDNFGKLWTGHFTASKN